MMMMMVDGNGIHVVGVQSPTLFSGALSSMNGRSVAHVA